MLPSLPEATKRVTLTSNLLINAAVSLQARQGIDASQWEAAQLSQQALSQQGQVQSKQLGTRHRLADHALESAGNSGKSSFGFADTSKV